MDRTRKKRLCEPGKLKELLRERRRSLAAKLGTTKNFHEFNMDTVGDLSSTPKTQRKRSLCHLAAPVKTLPDSPIERPTKLARRVSLRDEYLEVVHFPTRANTVGTPLASPASNTRGAIRRMATKDKSRQVDKSPQVEKSQPSPSTSPNGVTRKSLRSQGIIPSSPQGNQATVANKDKGAQEVKDMVEPPMEETKTNMKAVALNEPIMVEFNSHGQPIGAESIGMSSFLGSLVREIVPVTISDWRKIPPEMKEVLWKSIQVRYQLDKPWKKDYVFKTMGALWRASKSRLVKDIREAKNEEERLMLRPDNVKSISDWKAFVREKTSIIFQQKSARFSEIRKRQLPHTTSRKGYARLIEEMGGSNGSKTNLSRVDVWTKAHKKKSGEPVTSAVGEAIEKLKEIQQDPILSTTANVFNDALTVLLGPEKRGTVRGFGRGVNATKLQLKHLQETVTLLSKNQDFNLLSPKLPDSDAVPEPAIVPERNVSQTPPSVAERPGESLSGDDEDGTHSAQHLERVSQTTLGNSVETTPDTTSEGSCFHSKLKLFLGAFYGHNVASHSIEEFLKLSGQQKVLNGISIPEEAFNSMDEAIKKHGDFTASCWASKPIRDMMFSHLSLVFFGLRQIHLADLSEDIVLAMRDVVREAIAVGFEVDFLLDHLRKVVTALFGRKIYLDKLVALDNQIENAQKEFDYAKAKLEELKQSRSEIASLATVSSGTEADCIKQALVFGDSLVYGL